MKRSVAYLSIAISALSPAAHSACEQPLPAMRAQVAMVSCEGKVFYASPNAFTFLKQSGKEPTPDQVSLSGALITVEVVSSQRPEGAPDDFEAWEKGQMKTVFVDKPAAVVCPAPAQLPMRLTIVTHVVCCDTFPPSGLCLVPPAVEVVEIEKKG